MDQLGRTPGCRGAFPKDCRLRAPCHLVMWREADLKESLLEALKEVESSLSRDSQYSEVGRLINALVLDVSRLRPVVIGVHGPIQNGKSSLLSALVGSSNLFAAGRGDKSQTRCPMTVRNNAGSKFTLEVNRLSIDQYRKWRNDRV